MVVSRPIRFLVLSVFLCSLAAYADRFYVKPQLQNVSPDGATIIWQTEEKGQGVVEYGPAGSFNQKATGAPDELIRRVRLTGLKPDTAYSYRVTVGSEKYENTFKSSPGVNNEREVNFVIFGDTRRWEKRAEETHLFENLKQWNPEFFIINGDIVGTGHKYEMWPEHFDRFASVNGQFMVATARGNHEGSMLSDKENDWFAKYNEVPGGKEPYAAFDWGNVHVVLLSWEQTSMPALVKESAEWLDQHLKDVHSKYTFVCQHFPIYCTGYASPVDDRKQPSDTMAYLRRVVEKHDVTAHMSGHTHIYERIYPIRDGKRDDEHGVHYLVNGGDIGGNYPDWWTAVSDDKATMAKPTYTVYQCKKDRMEIRTFCWSPQGNAYQQIDHEIIWKDEAVPKSVFDSLKTKKGAELASAMEELGAMLYAPAAKPIVANLKDADQAVREAAAKALAILGNEGVASDLVPYLSDADPVVRRGVARSLEAAMPESLSKDIAKQTSDSTQDPATRIKLIGALQFHAPAALTRDTVVAILNSDAPAEVRQRAAYALGRVATKDDAQTLAKIFAKEAEPYVTLRLAFALNTLTGVQQSVSDKGPIAISKPGERGEIIAKWMGKS